MIIDLPPTGLSRPADVDVSDLTSAPRSGRPGLIEGTSQLLIPFDPEPTPDEQEAIRRRLLTRDAAHEAQVIEMQNALAALEASPTTPVELRDGVILALRALLGDLAPEETP